MSSVVPSPCIPVRCWFMDLPEPRPRSSHYLLSRRTSSCSRLLHTQRLFPSYLCHHLREHIVKFAVNVASYSSISKRSPLISNGKGRPTQNYKKLCKVVWTVEADLTDGQRLYLTGDLSALGCWKPELAVLMSPTEHCNLWKAEIKVACGLKFKYSYFIQGSIQLSSDIIWRGGPEYSLSVPLISQRDKRIFVRDSWLSFKAQRELAPVWGSWMEKTSPSVQPVVLTSQKDEVVISKNLRDDSFEAKQLFYDHTVKSSVESAITEGQESNKSVLQIYQLVEEPWLLQSFLSFDAPVAKESSDASDSSKELDKEEVIESQLHDRNLQDMEILLPNEMDSQVSVNDALSTVILINSSICTMQRIAVLEDEKLVELLLEPVKTNVQCDSVYLGVVTKLVPHMGGAFVNIGSSRPSLMEIKHTREPFIFSPFRRAKSKKDVDDFVLSMQQEHIARDDIDFTDDLADIDYQDDPVPYVNGDLEGQKKNLYVPEVQNKSVNGSVIKYGSTDAQFENCEDISGQDPVNTSAALFSVVTDPHDSKSPDSAVSTHTINKWAQVQKGTKIIVQVVKEGLGTKGPTLTAYPKLRSRFWILISRCDRVGISRKICGAERTRLRVIAKTLQPQGFGLTVRTVAVGHSLEDLQNDLQGLLATWKNVMEHAKSAALAADEGVEGAVPVLLHRAMGQTLSVVQDYFNEKVIRMVVDSPRIYHEVTSYLQEMAPGLCNRVELFNKRIPLFDEFEIEDEINNILNKRVSLVNGGSLVIEQTEALVSIDVNGGHGMFRQGASQEKATLDVNLAAAKQIARELRLRDIGGIIVVDFIDMTDDSNKRLVYEEMKKAVERDKSLVKVSELSKHGLMEITRKRVRPSVTFMISEPCNCCQSTGRVEAVETSFSKIEHEICRLLATMDQKADPGNPKTWPKIILRVDHYMCNYLTSGKRTRLATLSSSLKVWILLKVARSFDRGVFEVKPFTDDKVNQQKVTISMLQSKEVAAHGPKKKVTFIPVKSNTRGK